MGGSTLTTLALTDDITVKPVVIHTGSGSLTISSEPANVLLKGLNLMVNRST